MTIQRAFDTALKAAEPIIQEYVRQLKAENTKLYKQKIKLKIKISELKIQKESYEKEISKLQKALNKCKSQGGDIILQVNPSSLQNKK